MGCEEKFEKMS